MCWISLKGDPISEPTLLSMRMFPAFDYDDKLLLEENTMSLPSIPIDSTKGTNERSTEIAVKPAILLQTAPFQLHFGPKILLECLVIDIFSSTDYPRFFKVPIIFSLKMSPPNRRNTKSDITIESWRKT